MAEYNADAVQAAIDKDKTIGKQEGKAIHALLKGRARGMAKEQQDAADQARFTFQRPRSLRSLQGADTLYILTVSGDLAEYYDSQQGEGAWDALTADDQATIVRSVQRALDGFMEDREIAFDAGITASGIA